MSIKAALKNVGYDPHPLVNDLAERARNDQVAMMLLRCCISWMDTETKWPSLCEGRYDRNTKLNQTTFAVFSNALEGYGKESTELPFFQIEVDRYTKKPTRCKSIPTAFGICESLFSRETLRNVSFPYLSVITTLLAGRGYTPIGVYFDEGTDRPLQIDIVGGRSIWRIMLWQNRLINEYNELIKLDKEKFYSEPDDTYKQLLEISSKSNNRISFDYDQGAIRNEEEAVSENTGT